jgi:hypothetical protein
MLEKPMFRSSLICLLVLIVWVPFARAGSSVFAPEFGVDFTLRPSVPAFILGQPVELSATFKHALKDTVDIEFGGGFTENLHFSIQKQDAAQAIEIDGASPSGVFAPGILKVEPGAAATHNLILDEHFVITEPGEYKITLSINKTLKADTKVRVFATETDAKNAGIVPVPNVALTCEELLKTYQQKTAPSSERQRAYKLLTYTRHPAAVPFLLKLFETNPPLPTDHHATLARALVATGDASCIERVIKTVFEKMPKNSNHRRMTAYYLHEYGLSKLPAESQRLLETYKDEINSASKLEVGD